MAIRTATIGRQRTLSGLAKALFDLKGSNLTLADAEAALLKANPHLAEASGFVRGATVIVPELRGAVAVGGAAAQADAGEATKPVAEQLAQLIAYTDRTLDQAIAAAKANVEGLQDRTFLAALSKGRPDLVQRLPDIQKVAKEDVSTLDAAGTALRKALGRAAADLKRSG